MNGTHRYSQSTTPEKDAKEENALTNRNGATK